MFMKTKLPVLIIHDNVLLPQTEIKIEIKSVPPEELSAIRQKLMAIALIIPPKIAHKRTSFVRLRPGIISVRKPETIIIITEYKVNFFPMYLNPI